MILIYEALIIVQKKIYHTKNHSWLYETQYSYFAFQARIARMKRTIHKST